MKSVFIIANWKMNKGTKEAIDFVNKVAPLAEKFKNVYIAAPYTVIGFISKISNFVTVGSQDISQYPCGAHTGDISSTMLKEEGAKFSLIGHSERRNLLKESDKIINEKIKRAISDGLLPVLCVGETGMEKEDTEKVLELQITRGLAGIKKDDSIMIAYEPVWAIGTGRAASPGMAQQAHLTCRKILNKNWGKEFAEKVPILYGGSVKSETVKAIIREKDIDGVLVGNASLDVDSFSKIVENSI